MARDGLDWIREGVEAGWCSPLRCETHEGLPFTDAEDAEWEAGGDPCIFAVRINLDAL